MKSAGLPESVAKQVEQRYHTTYKVSIDWINRVLDKAHTTGYVVGAFGLKIRTTILKKTIKSSKMSYPAKAERKSAGNAVTQSYGLLNSRATNEFMQRVWRSHYKYLILPCAQIHDATYFTWRDNPGITKWVNDNLIDCMRWQDLPELYHPTVKMDAELDLYWPDWKSKVTLSTDISTDEIKTLALAHRNKIGNVKN